MMQQSRQRIIETMRERNMTKVNLVMTLEEYAKENGFDDVDDAEDDYNDYMSNDAPWVIYFNKWGNGRDYAAMSVELVDGEHPRFRLSCHNDEDGDDTFDDDELTNLSMVNVYERMLEELDVEDDKKYVWVFTADQIADADVMDIITRVFETEQSALDCLYEFVHGDDGELAYAEKRGWKVEYDKPNHFRAYEEGHYCQNHTEATVEMIEVKR
jgi:hypothetical protein